MSAGSSGFGHGRNLRGMRMLDIVAWLIGDD